MTLPTDGASPVSPAPQERQPSRELMTGFLEGALEGSASPDVIADALLNAFDVRLRASLPLSPQPDKTEWILKDEKGRFRKPDSTPAREQQEEGT